MNIISAVLGGGLMTLSSYVTDSTVCNIYMTNCDVMLCFVKFVY